MSTHRVSQETLFFCSYFRGHQDLTLERYGSKNSAYSEQSTLRVGDNYSKDGPFQSPKNLSHSSQNSRSSNVHNNNNNRRHSGSAPEVTGSVASCLDHFNVPSSNSSGQRQRQRSLSDSRTNHDWSSEGENALGFPVLCPNSVTSKVVLYALWHTHGSCYRLLGYFSEETDSFHELMLRDPIFFYLPSCLIAEPLPQAPPRTRPKEDTREPGWQQQDQTQPQSHPTKPSSNGLPPTPKVHMGACFSKARKYYA